MTNHATVEQLGEFDEIIDVRTPSEFAEDHVPGARNFPVLDDEERARIGTMYKQVSPFDAKKAGAALIARNIAEHLERYFHDKPKDWHPLIYCWRGGKRSGSMTHILNQIGWKAEQLEGGYKAYRRAVSEELATLPAQYLYCVVCGLTGTGKSRLLKALSQAGAQVLDLEGMASHRGSVLGNLPDIKQPSQKMFESMIWWQLKQFDPTKPIFVEAESKKIGVVRVPDSLLDAMWKSRCIQLDMEPPLRVKLLKEEYEHFLQDPSALHAKLDLLRNMYGSEQIERWKTMSSQQEWDALVSELLERHYDPAYTRSTLKHYPQLSESAHLTGHSIDEAEMHRLALEAIKSCTSHRSA